MLHLDELSLTVKQDRHAGNRADGSVLVCDYRILCDCQDRASEVALVQSEVFVSMLSHSVRLGFSETMALKSKSRLTDHHHDHGSDRITLAHLSVTHTLHRLTSSWAAERLLWYIAHSGVFFIKWCKGDTFFTQLCVLGSLKEAGRNCLCTF